MTLEERFDQVRSEIADLACQAGRDAREVKLIAVSKTVGLEEVGRAIEYGQTDFAENRPQLFKEKQEAFPQVRWHLIGQLQTNKVRDVVGRACLIHSLERPSLLEAIQKRACALDCIQDVLIEVNVSGEASKAGLCAAEVPAFTEEILKCPNIRCCGLMTMAPMGDLTVARRTFEKLRKLADSMQTQYGYHDIITFDELSMGMSGDYACAIAEGATMVRVGRKLFSDAFAG